MKEEILKRFKNVESGNLTRREKLLLNIASDIASQESISDEEMLEKADEIASELDGGILMVEGFIQCYDWMQAKTKGNAVEGEIKIQFIIDGTESSGVYKLKDILEGISEENILENMEVCTCQFNESVNHCECEPQYMDSGVTDMRIL